MVEFQEGTLDTLMERLCSGISSFDPEWEKHCVPATEEQIRQLKDILAEYNYTIPAAYLYYLKRMGQDDGGLLENEGDVCFYMKISNKEDNPMVTDWGGVYVTESFEKYLFRKAFRMYQRGFTYIDFQSNAGCDHPEKKKKENCRTCPYCADTVEERMDFINQMAESYGIKKAWFSDQLHFICYRASYAFEISVCTGYSVEFCCNDDKLWEQVKYSLSTFPKFFACLSLFGN